MASEERQQGLNVAQWNTVQTSDFSNVNYYGAPEYEAEEEEQDLGV